LRDKKTREQKKFHEPIRRWLESNGVRVLPESEKMPVPIKDVFPAQHYLFPDIIGIRDIDQVVVVEVETVPDKILEVMGKCMLWKTIATYVYIAYPREKCHKFKVLEKFGMGLLGASDNDIEEIVEILPAKGTSHGILKVLELHPRDPPKEHELYSQIKRLVEASETRELSRPPTRRSES